MSDFFTQLATLGYKADERIKGSSAKLSFLILLKTFQQLGYAVPLASVPATITRHIAASAQLSFLVYGIGQGMTVPVPGTGI